MHLTAKERRLQKVRMTPLQRVSINRPLRRQTSLRNPADDIDQTGKGELGGKCNRTACTTRGADVQWWNRPMRAHYCRGCMRLIRSYDEDRGTDSAIFETTPRTVPDAPTDDGQN